MLTLVFQEGYLLDLMGLDRTGPIETFVPPIAFAILFGLFMDYMVFLMSRIREEHVHGLRTREAVEHGIAAIGRVVVAAPARDEHRPEGDHRRAHRKPPS